MFSPPNMFADAQDVTFRPAKPTDVYRLAAIHVECWRKAYTQQFPAILLDSISINEYIPKWRKILAENKQPTYMMVLNHRVVGFIGIGAAANASASTGEIKSLYVQPEYWRQGIGATASEYALNQLQAGGFTTVIVWCLKDYPPARRLYSSRFSMTIDSEEVRYYYDYPKIRVRYRRDLTVAPT